MGVITKPSSVQRSGIVWLLGSCGRAAGCGGTRPPVVISRGSIPQTRPSAQGAARAAADPDSSQKTAGYCWSFYFHVTWLLSLRWILEIFGPSTKAYVRHNFRHLRDDQQYPGVLRDTTKGLRIPSVSRLSLLFGATSV